MAKQKKRLPARKPRDGSGPEDSILLRSAETLGRMIGTLHRQLNGAAKILSETADDAGGVLSEAAPTATRTGARTRKTAGARKTAAGERKTTAGRKTKAARKTTRARKATRSR